MEKIRTVLDQKVTKEFMRSGFIFAYISIGVSLLVLSVYVLFGILNNSWLDTTSIILLIAGSALLLLSLFLLFFYINAVKKAGTFIRTAEYEFLDDAIVYTLYRNDEKIEEGKQYYEDLVDYKESKNYVFVRLKNNTFFAMDKVDGLVAFLSSKGLPKFKNIRKN